MKALAVNKIVLELNDHEASWLKSVMQNPLHDVHPDDEFEEDREMRAKFFEILKSALLR